MFLLSDGPLALLPRAAPILILVLAGWIVGRSAEREAPRFGLPRPAIADLTPALVVIAIVAARLTTAVPHWRMVIAHPLDLLRVNGQLSFFGGVVGAAAGLPILARRSRLPVWRVADAYGVAVPLGFAVHGLGCLLRDDCYGRVAPPPLGIVFPSRHDPRYPVELYAAAAALFCYVGLRWIARRRLPPGTVALAAVTVLAASGGLLDLLRLEAEDGMLGGKRLISLAIAALALSLLQLRLVRTSARPVVAPGAVPPCPSPPIFDPAVPSSRRLG